MKRVALLIGAPGWKNQPGFLPGVALDISNYRQFLLSATGGAWLDHEIPEIPLNPTVQPLLRFVRQLRVDYALVVFSGHGSLAGAGSTSQQLVQVNPTEQVALRHLVPDVPKALVLVDACRVFQGTSLAGFLGEEYRQFPSALPAATARQEYERQIHACVPGYATLFACQPGATSQDTTSGGNFSLTLLDAVNEWVHTPGPTTCLTTLEAMRRTDYYLAQQQPVQQRPQLVRSRELARHPVQLPFALRKPTQLVRG